MKTKKTAVLDLIDDAKDYRYFEVWLDYIEDLDQEFINLVTRQYRGKLIMVFRRQNLESPVMDLQPRLSILSLLANREVTVDLDIITQQEELNYLVNNMIKVSLITSYHNYQETPEDKKLIEVISIMMNYRPDIIKIATMCNEPKDALRLLDLLISLKREQKRYIISGMGGYGTITRIHGDIWGNELIFAPEKKSEATAPGQLTKEEHETIFKILDAKT